MSAVGIFAGWGDVIVALAFIIGAWVGWKARQLFYFIKHKAGQ